MQPQDHGRSLCAFLTLWTGQLISGLGSGVLWAVVVCRRRRKGAGWLAAELRLTGNRW